MKTTIPVLDASSADFITHHVSIIAASCNRDRVPSITRAFGCRVSPDRQTVTLFLSVPRSTDLLRDLQDGGAIAAVFTRPSTHETLQLKGSHAGVSAPESHDRERMQVYRDSLAEDLRKIGWHDRFASALSWPRDEEIVSVTFSPTAVFVQTPGPAAGQKLASRP